MSGDNLIPVLSITLLGVLVIFSVLIILMLVLTFMKVFAPSENNEVKTNKSEVKAPETTPKTISNNTDEEELIAVLAAAIASSLNTSVSNLRIRSYRRLKTKN